MVLTPANDAGAPPEAQLLSPNLQAGSIWRDRAPAVLLVLGLLVTSGAVWLTAMSDSRSAPLPWAVASVGCALSLLTFGLVYSLARSRRMALGLAAQMTADLRERETDLREANDHLDKLNRDLEHSNQAMRDFVSVASHELRTPITSVLGFADIMTKNWEVIGDTEKQEFLGIIDRQARRLSRIVSDLLTLSNSDAGKIDVNKEVVDVRVAIEQAIEYYAQTAEFTISSPDDLQAYTDPDHLHRIIANYAGNAVKYGAPPFTIEAVGAGEWVEIRVGDQGEGVAVEFLTQLFDKFARSEDHRASKHKGSGLGLSIVHALAQANGGNAWYETNLPKGSCFGLRIPKATSQ